MEKQYHELVYKILVVGDIGTGKTSIIKRYVQNLFSIHYKSTIGVDFALKTIKFDNDTTVRLQLWDIAGQERFNNMTRVYYKDAIGALVVFDITRSSTRESVIKWKNDIDTKLVFSGTNTKIPTVLIANKTDLLSEEDNNSNMASTDMDTFCKEYGFVSWFETSAKSGVGIKNAFDTLVETIIKMQNISTNPTITEKNDIITLDNTLISEKKCVCTS